MTWSSGTADQSSKITKFYVLLNAHPCIILQIKPNWCTVLLNVFIYFLYIVSGDYVPIIRRNNCIYATLGICHSVWMTGMTPHTRQSSTQTDKYQVSHTIISPDDGHIVAQNNVKERNKHTKKNFAPVGFICKITRSKIE